MRAIFFIVLLLVIASFFHHQADARAIRPKRTLAKGENCTWTEKTMQFKEVDGVKKRCYVYSGDKNMCVNKGQNEEEECSPSYIKSCNYTKCEENYGI